MTLAKRRGYLERSPVSAHRTIVVSNEKRKEEDILNGLLCRPIELYSYQSWRHNADKDEVYSVISSIGKSSVRVQATSHSGEHIGVVVLTARGQQTVWHVHIRVSSTMSTAAYLKYVMTRTESVFYSVNSSVGENSGRGQATSIPISMSRGVKYGTRQNRERLLQCQQHSTVSTAQRRWNIGPRPEATKNSGAGRKIDGARQTLRAQFWVHTVTPVHKFQTSPAFLSHSSSFFYAWRPQNLLTFRYLILWHVKVFFFGT